MSRSTNSVVHWSNRFYLVIFCQCTCKIQLYRAMYKCSQVYSNGVRAQIFPKRHPCSGEETNETLGLSAKWSCSHCLALEAFKEQLFFLFGRSRDETVVKYSVTAVVNGEGEGTTFCVNEY